LKIYFTDSQNFSTCSFTCPFVFLRYTDRVSKIKVDIKDRCHHLTRFVVWCFETRTNDYCDKYIIVCNGVKLVKVLTEELETPKEPLVLSSYEQEAYSRG